MNKRKKHVFDTGEIPHLWAHQTQDEARNRQGNLYFTGDTIYSYGSHFPIARRVTNDAGELAIAPLYVPQSPRVFASSIPQTYATDGTAEVT
jgi:hypothetical protein